MEKEKKYFKGIFIGFLLIVVMLFGVVINMGKTYSADTTPNCVSEGGVEYVWTTSALSSSNGACCPKGGSGYDSVRKVCAAIATKKSNCTDESASCYSCPNGYALVCDNPGTGSSNGTACTCSKKPGKTVENVCYSCSGRYAWGDSVTSYNCPSTWEIMEGITKESDCKNTVSSYEVNFNTDGGTFYVDNKLASSTTQSLSTIEWSKYTAKKEGYAFKGWTNTKTSDCSSAYTSGSSNVLANKTVFACYEKEAEKKYTVTLNAGSGGIVKISKNNTVTDTAQQNYEIKNLSNGYSLALSSYIAETNGKSFKGWSKSSSCNSIIRVYTINNNNATLYACYSDTNNDGNDGTTKYTATFNPNGGTFSDGTTTSKTVQYTGKKYFTDSDISVTKSGATFVGWRSSKSDLTSFIDGAENGETLTAIWYDNSSSDSGDSGNEGNNCEYITKESCETYYDGYSCIEDNNGCFVPDDEIEDNQKQCEFESKESCEILNEGYTCKKDSDGCFVKYGKIDNDSGSSDSKEPVSNPNTGTSLLYLAIIMAVGTLVYTIYYVFKLRKEN